MTGRVVINDERSCHVAAAHTTNGSFDYDHCASMYTDYGIDCATHATITCVLYLETLPDYNYNWNNCVIAVVYCV